MMDRKTSIAVGSFLGTSILIACAQGQVPAFSSTGFLSDSPASFAGTKGWSFNRGGWPSTNSIAITQLGVFDSNGDGLASPHQVGLWRSDGTLLASGVVAAGQTAPLVGGYRYVSIAPVVVPVGQSGFYIVAAQYTEADADDQNTPLAGPIAPPLWTYNLQGKYGYGFDLPFPSFETIPPCLEYYGPIYWEANFQFSYTIPEPASWQFAGTGLLLLLLRRRSIR